MDPGAWQATVHGAARVRHNLATKPPAPYKVHQFSNRWAKNIQWGKDVLFNKQCWENWTATCRRMMLDHCLNYTQIVNSEWVKTCKTWNHKTRRKRQWTHWHQSWQWFFFLFGFDPKSTSATKSNWKAFAQQRKPSTKWKGNHWMGENICKSDIW